MATGAVSAQGTLLKIGDGASTEAFTLVPEVIDVSAPDVKTDLLEATSHDSPGGFKEWIAGLRDGGTIPVKFNYITSNIIHQGFRTDNYAGTRRNFQLSLIGATLNKVAFSCYIEGFKVTANKNTIQICDAQLRVTGLPVWS